MEKKRRSWSAARRLSGMAGLRCSALLYGIVRLQHEGKGMSEKRKGGFGARNVRVFLSAAGSGLGPEG